MSSISLLDEKSCFQTVINQHSSVATLAENIAHCLRDKCQSTNAHVFLYMGINNHLKTVYSSNNTPPTPIPAPKANDLVFKDNNFIFPIHYENKIIGFILFEDFNLSEIETHLQRLKALYAVIGTKFYALIEQEKYQNEKRIINEHLIHFKISPAGTITDISDAMLEELGYQKHELLGSLAKDLIMDPTPNAPEKNFDSPEIQLKKKNGDPIWVKSTLAPSFNFLGEMAGQMCLQQNISEQKRIQEMSITDDLTQLYNRRFFNTTFDIEIDRAKRQKSILAFMIIDIDNFKKYNDTYGHPAGDKALTAVAASLSSCYKRKGDYVFRIGGEEFGILCNITQADDAALLADICRASVQSLNIEHTGNPHKVITISTGVFVMDANCPINLNIDSQEIYKAADSALYEAKETGRNKVVVAGESDDIELF